MKARPSRFVTNLYRIVNPSQLSSTLGRVHVTHPRILIFFNIDPWSCVAVQELAKITLLKMGSTDSVATALPSQLENE